MKGLMEEVSPEAVQAAIQYGRWYAQAHNAAVRLWIAGTAGPEIAAAMWADFQIKKLKSAVIGRMFRAGLTFEGPRGKTVSQGGVSKSSPAFRRAEMPADVLARVRERDRIRKGRTGPVRPPAPAKRGRDGVNDFDVERPVRPRTETIPSLPKPPKPKPIPVDSRIVQSLRIPIWEAREGQCRYIAGDPLVDATVCGHRVLPGSAWCPGHHAVCCEGHRRTSLATFGPRPAVIPQPIPKPVRRFA